MAVNSEGVYYPTDFDNFDDFMLDWKQTADTTADQFTLVRKVEYAEFTATVSTFPATEWGVGPMVVDTTRTINSPATYNASALIVPAGSYAFTWMMSIGVATSGRAFLDLRIGSTAGEIVQRTNIISGEDRGGLSIAAMRFTAQTTLVPRYFITYGATQDVQHRIRIKRIGN